MAASGRRIREAKLDGFEFRKIWPLPDGVYWWLHRKLPECHDELTAQPASEARAIKGNAVVEARFENTVFVNCDFRGTLFLLCAFSGVTFVNCQLDGALFSDCTVVGQSEPPTDQPDATDVTRLVPDKPKFNIPGAEKLADTFRRYRSEDATSADAHLLSNPAGQPAVASPWEAGREARATVQPPIRRPGCSAAGCGGVDGRFHQRCPGHGREQPVLLAPVQWDSGRAFPQVRWPAAAESGTGALIGRALSRTRSGSRPWRRIC
jgi:hypothetical protein